MRVGGHTNTYHTRSAEEAYAGIAAGGLPTVELTVGRSAGRSTSTSTRRRPTTFDRLRHYGLDGRRCSRRTPT